MHVGRASSLPAKLKVLVVCTHWNSASVEADLCRTGWQLLRIPTLLGKNTDMRPSSV